MAHMQITIIPVGTGSTSVGDYITDVERFLQDKRIEHRLHDMGTIITGSTSELLKLSEEIHRLPFTRGAKRVVTHITLDERLDMERGIDEKEQSVISRIQE